MRLSRQAPAALLSIAICAAGQDAADSDYARGMSAARQARWEEAKAAFETGWRKASRDKRFPIELAGIAFKLKHYPEARAKLRAALRLDAQDRYANDFLGTLYFLDDNLEAALKYWNRAGKPRVEQVRLDPEAQTDPVLLDRAFAFSPAAVLGLREFRETEARLEWLDVFFRSRLELQPREGGAFDARLRAQERSGWRASPPAAVVSLLRGLPYQTVYPEFLNLGRSAANFRSLVRWDAQKRRAAAEFSAPFRRDPGRRYRLWAEGRRENWDLPGWTGLRLDRFEAGTELAMLHGARLRSRTGARVAHRAFGNPLPGDPAFTSGASLTWTGALDYDLLRVPERRFRLESGASFQLGKLFAQGFDPFSKAQTSLAARWLPQARGDDFATTARLRAGTISGDAPFDELFLLGVERDTDLWLRGHPATENGRKGRGPLARDYVLLNLDLDKTVYRGGPFNLSIGPFLDAGRAGHPQFGSRGWLWDPGLRAKVRVFGDLTVALSFSRGAFFATTSR